MAPGEGVGDVYSEVSDAGYPLHSCTADVERRGAVPVLWKSTIISLVLVVFRMWLFSLHHSSSPPTFCLYAN